MPKDINVVDEIPSHGTPVKYGVEKGSGSLMVERFMEGSHDLSVQLWLFASYSVGRWRTG
jgi:inorganic pyrophosphatase